VTPVLVVHPDVPAKTIQEFVAWAKAEGDKLSYASTGNGSASNLAMELFKGATGLQAVHVPYRGSAPAVQDLIGGVVTCSLQTLPSVLSQIRSNKPRALAVSSLKRNANLPDVPTVDETVANDITPSIPAELADFVTVEIVKWAKVVKDSGAKAE
jgi:tripartite-type tricarboxylate transporter receptor subunit TctC